MLTDSKYFRNLPIAIKNDDGFKEIINLEKKLEKADYLMNNWIDFLVL